MNPLISSSPVAAKTMPGLLLLRSFVGRPAAAGVSFPDAQ
jgi:hypothetical protein